MKKRPMKSWLEMAASAWKNGCLGVKKFSYAYRMAVKGFGDDAKQRFRQAYPIFGDREWRRLDLVADGILLPEFFFKSDSFIGKLLKMKDSLKWQNRIRGAAEDISVSPAERELNVEDLVRKVNNSHDRHGRSARKILQDMSYEIVNYSALRDEEWDFEERNGNREFWSEEVCKAHDDLLSEIQVSRDRLTKLVREATGDKEISV